MHVCVVDAAGKVVFRGVCRTEPAALHERLTKRAPDLGRAALESGALASWLTHGLASLGVPVVCVCARQAHAALQHGPRKTDRSDAEGPARLAQTGWLKQVHVRSLASHEAKSLVIARERLVHVKQDPVNLIRGLLKPFGILTSRLGGSRFDARIREFAADRGTSVRGTLNEKQHADPDSGGVSRDQEDGDGGGCGEVAAVQTSTPA